MPPEEVDSDWDEVTEKNEVFETMTTFTTSHLSIRVWREEKSFKMGPDPEVIDALIQVRDKLHRGATAKAFVEAMKNLERISAIEVLNKNSGDGGLYYPDWC